NELIYSVLLEDVDEKQQVQHISAYLHSLKDRLRVTIQQHQDVVHSSVQLLKDLSDVNNMVQVGESGNQTQVPKIRRLIMGFETVSAAQLPPVPGSIMPSDISGMRSLLTEFEDLHESQVLREALSNCKRARESLDKVLAILDRIGGESPGTSIGTNQDNGSQSDNKSLREKIVAFNKVLETESSKPGDPCIHFAKCFSSRTSLEDQDNQDPVTATAQHAASRTNSGYEGDVDSEVE
ncbi:hypothetical protein KR018_011352, partial [Drosophila ironensis]